MLVPVSFSKTTYPARLIRLNSLAKLTKLIIFFETEKIYFYFVH